MEVTQVNVKLINDVHNRFLGYAKITLDDVLVIHDIKIIAGNGGIFIGMPTHKTMSKCPECTHKNHIRSNYCNDCGSPLSKPNLGDIKYYHDIAHPISSSFRDYMEDCILYEYESLKIMDKVETLHLHSHTDYDNTTKGVS